MSDIEKLSPYKPGILKGKVALVTGGGSGINFGIARWLAYHGANVALMGRRQEVLERACKELKDSFNCNTAAIQGDVRSADAAVNAVKKTVESFGRIDILINGAAGNFLCNAEDLSPNAFKTVMEIDLFGTFNMSRAAFPELIKTKGNIINISATLHYGATPWQTHAASAKAGVDSLTRSMALEWGDFGIRVNGIAPGPIKDTEGMKRLAPGVDIDAQLGEFIPLKRAGTVDDIGASAIYLLSNAASYVTGHVLVVDGGDWMSFKPRVLTRELIQSLQVDRKKSKL